MNPDTLHLHLSKMSQKEIIDHLNAEVKNARSLKAKTDKAELSEKTLFGSKTATARSWSNSEQFEKSKDAIRIIVKYLI